MTTNEPATPALSVHLVPGGRGHVTCHGYDDRGPILAIHEAGSSVTIATDVRPTGGQVRFARDLAAAVAVFLAECERHTVAGPADSRAA